MNRTARGRMSFPVIFIKGDQTMKQRKNLAMKKLVHFFQLQTISTTIPCKPNTANGHTESCYVFFGKICPCTNNIVYVRFEVLRTFLCVFMSIFRDFICYKL